MNQKERSSIALVLAGIIVMVSIDLFTDSREGVVWWHVFIEGSVALGAAWGIFLILRDTFQLQNSLNDEKKKFSELQVEAEKWRSQYKKYLDGLSQAIDSQLSCWQLSSSEKEVAFLLLKGLSLKEIADIRKTTEKTARAQSVAVYAKAGLGGRSELAAFFLEDLLLPNDTGNDQTLLKHDSNSSQG